jgi:CubicO group peptidase (beta-lactamase class C family)
MRHFLITLRLLSLAVALNLILIVQAATAQSSPAPSQATQQNVSASALAPRMDEYLNRLQRMNRFSGSVLVARNGQAILSRGYGLANRERNEPNTQQTKFRIGSVTKQFTAAAILLLQERGRLGVNDSICRFVADCPQTWQPVTIHQLLTHTSGIPNFTAFPEYGQLMTAPRTVAEIINTFRSRPLDFAPGTRFSYSNSGYILLGHIIERASNQTYGEFLRANVFAPLEMRNTGYATNEAALTNRAVGYTRDGDNIVVAQPIDMTVPFAAGGIYSTVEDLLKWDQALYTDRLLSRASRDAMFSRPYAFSDYGYGWVMANEGGRRTILHGGAIDGFQSFIARFPDERATVIVLSNNETTNDEQISRDLAGIMFGASVEMPRERRAIALAPEILNRYVGRYQLAPNFIITVTNENNRLMAQATAQDKLELFAESETDFFYQAVDAQITFERDAQGLVTGMVLHQNGRHIPGRRLSDNERQSRINVDARTLATYTGEYQLAPNVIVAVRLEGGRLMTQITGQQPFELIAQSETRFLVGGIDAEVEFERDATQNRTAALIIRQNGNTMRAAKIR